MNDLLLKREKIRSQLAEMGAEPKRSLGQNFLVAEHVIEKTVRAAAGCASQSILEIGPGLGALTRGLQELGRPLAVIELDRVFARYWREQGLNVHEGDALKIDWSKLSLQKPILLVSNLPYQISSSLVIERSIDPCGVESMVLMFQKEVAQRLMAKSGGKEFGLLSVIAQTFWQLRFLLEAGPGDFYPVPQVASRVIVFRAQNPTHEIHDREKFLRFCKLAFAHRRKLLIRNLEPWFSDRSAEARKLLLSSFQTLGLSEQARAEELEPTQFQRLYLELTTEPRK